MSSLDSYRLIEKIGEGELSKVWEALATDGTRRAIKIFDLGREGIRDWIRKELEMNARLDHHSIPRVIESKERAHLDEYQNDVAYIVQELVSGGELFDYIVETGAFPEKVCRVYLDQLLDCLEYIHSRGRGIAHLDLKLENILLSEAENFKIKVIDFGLAEPLDGLERTTKGTKGYLAPEVLSQQPCNGMAVDLFALGVILCCMHTGNPPFTNAMDSDDYYQYFCSDSEFFWIDYEQRAKCTFSKEFKNLINKMLKKKPSERLTIEGIRNDAWLSQDAARSSTQEINKEFKRRTLTLKTRKNEPAANQQTNEILHSEL